MGVRKDQRGTDVASRADGTEDISILIALISDLAWTAATLGPLIDKAVLLSNARLVLEPDLNRLSRPDPLFRQVLNHLGRPLGMLWPCAHIGKAEVLQKAPDTDLPLIDFIGRSFSFCAFVNFGGRPGEVALMTPLGPFAL